MIAFVADPKARLRARIRASRAQSAHRAQADTWSRGLVRTARAAGLVGGGGSRDSTTTGTLAAYIAAAGEPDVGLLRSSFREAGATVLLPIPRPDYTLGWAVDDGRYRDDPRLPIQVPEGVVVGVGADGLIDHDVRLVLIPALAVDGTGARLGQGGGYYDRLLAEARGMSHAVHAVAVVHDDELLPAGAITAAAHDIPVQAALTPTTYTTFPV